jgi:hypothetical protein
VINALQLLVGLSQGDFQLAEHWLKIAIYGFDSLSCLVEHFAQLDQRDPYKHYEQGETTGQNKARNFAAAHR